jgi:hypothetical protein
MQKPGLFDIWHDDTVDVKFPFRAQLVGYIGNFPTLEKAESFVAAIKRWREQAAKSVVNAVPTRKSK